MDHVTRSSMSIHKNLGDRPNTVAFFFELQFSNYSNSFIRLFTRRTFIAPVLEPIYSELNSDPRAATTKEETSETYCT